MDTLVLDVRLDGFDRPVGKLVRDRDGALAFAYHADHLANPEALGLSLSLPLTDEPFADPVIRPFLDNMLQERDGILIKVMQRENLARDDLAGLLMHMGKDCPGAISILPEGAPPARIPGDYAKDYRPISGDRMAAIIAALHQRRALPDDTGDPSPLAGVQSKIALTMLPDGTFAEPEPGSGAPTTHILKVPDRDHLADPFREAEAMALAQAAALDAADVVATEINGIPVLLIRRFDRGLDSQGRIVRLHQEDFAQALGLPPLLKYERNGKGDRRFSMAAIAGLLNLTANPALEKDRFIATTLFNLMIGNVDNHAKNHALVYRRGAKPWFAPLYDLLPTRLDPQLTDEFAFSIGSANTLDAITQDDLVAFIATFGISSKSASLRILRRHATRLSTSLLANLPILDQAGAKRFADLIASNSIAVLSALELPVPPELGNRDLFLERGGGWLIS